MRNKIINSFNQLLSVSRVSALLCVVSAKCLEILDNFSVNWDEVSTRTFLSRLLRKLLLCSSDDDNKSFLDILSMTQELMTFAFLKAFIVVVICARWFSISTSNSDFFFSFISNSVALTSLSILDLKAAIFPLPSVFNSFRNSRGPVHCWISLKIKYKIIKIFYLIKSWHYYVQHFLVLCMLFILIQLFYYLIIIIIELLNILEN